MVRIKSDAAGCMGATKFTAGWQMDTINEGSRPGNKFNNIFIGYAYVHVLAFKCQTQTWGNWRWRHSRELGRIHSVYMKDLLRILSYTPK